MVEIIGEYGQVVVLGVISLILIGAFSYLASIV